MESESFRRSICIRRSLRHSQWVTRLIIPRNQPWDMTPTSFLFFLQVLLFLSCFLLFFFRSFLSFQVQGVRDKKWINVWTRWHIRATNCTKNMPPQTIRKPMRPKPKWSRSLCRNRVNKNIIHNVLLTPNTHRVVILSFRRFSWTKVVDSKGTTSGVRRIGSKFSQ